MDPIGTELCRFRGPDSDEYTISRRIETILSCALCRLPYKEPKTLPCAHTFCKRCLGDYVLQQRIQETERCPAYFLCPTCQRTCPVPARWANLPSQEILKTLAETVNSSTSTQECTICGAEGKRLAAAYYCVKCEDFLCEECSRSHKRTRLTRDHLLVRVSSMQYAHKTQTSATQICAKFGRHGDDLNFPHSICSNKADDVLVSNDNNDIAVFAAGGSCKKHLNQQPFYGDTTKHPHNPNRGISFTQEGFLAVAIRRKSHGDNLTCVAVIESLASREIGNCLTKISDYGACLPSGLAVMMNNSIVVSDVGLHCIYVFDEKYRFVRKFGKKGTSDSKFLSPHYVAVNRRNEILVSDHGNHCVKVFDSRGKFRRRIGGMGSNNGHLLHPMGLCVDPDGNVLVADRDNHRIQVFDTAGKYICTIVKETFEKGKDIRPVDVTFNNSGQLLVLLKGIEGEDFAEIRAFEYDLDGSKKRRKKRALSKNGRHGSAPAGEQRDVENGAEAGQEGFPTFEGKKGVKGRSRAALPPIGGPQRVYERPIYFEHNADNRSVSSVTGPARPPSAPPSGHYEEDYYEDEPRVYQKGSGSKVRTVQAPASKVCSIM